MFELLYCNAGRRSAVLFLQRRNSVDRSNHYVVGIHLQKVSDDCVVDDMIGDSFENISGYHLISVNDIQVKGKDFVSTFTVSDPISFRFTRRTP